ncbi:MAG: YhdP family protein, partial [Comamonadaceae bacterium]|nr:YhdP family protein [Comamonadaceae bacterium]
GDASADTAVADWFFSQPELLLRGGQVRWVDDKRGAPPVTLSDVRLLIRNGPRRHQMQLDATPEAAWGERFTLVGHFRQPLLARHAGQWQRWSGRAWASLPRIDVSRLRQYAELGIDLREGHGALRAWVDVRDGRLRAATADVALGRVAAVLAPRLPPLALRALTGRVEWEHTAQGMALRTRDLRFEDAGGSAWPGGNIALTLRDGAGGAATGGGELRADRLDLAALARLAAALPLGEAVHARLAAHPVQGLVEHLSADWTGPLPAPADWRVRLKARGLAVAAQAAARAGDAGLPGIEGATLDVDARPGGGTATLAIAHGALSFPGVFEEPRIALTSLNAGARWRVQGEHIAIDVDELRLHNADATGRFKARWHTSDPAASRSGSRFPGVLDLQGRFSRANGARVHRYLPLGIPAEARHYVRDAIREGEARDVAVRIQGDLWDVPFDRPGARGEFRFAGQVRNVRMAYVPRRLQPAAQAPWPALTGLTGELVFERNSMHVRNARASVQDHPGWRFEQIDARIPDLGHTRVLVQGHGRGTLAAALGIVRASPVAQFTSHALDRAEATGDGQLRLSLDLPVMHIEQAQARGEVTLAGNNLLFTPQAPLLQDVHGRISFSETGFAVHEARARLLGGEAVVSGGMPDVASAASAANNTPPAAPRVRLHARGTASADGLRAMRDWGPVPGIAARASGSAAYEAVIGFTSDEPDVRVTSDLRGLAVDLPAPLAKPADAAWPLRYERRAQPGTPHDRLHLSVANRLRVEVERATTGQGAAAATRVLRGAAALGDGAAPRPAAALPASGMTAQATLARLDADAWEKALDTVFPATAASAPATSTAALATTTATALPPAAASAPAPLASTPSPAPAADYRPTRLSLRSGQLVAGGRTWHDVTATGARDGRHWRASVQARELAGQLEYREASATDAGLLHARLAHLTLPETAPGDGADTASGAGQDSHAIPLADEPPSRIPALDVAVQHFTLRGKPLGRLEVQAVNQGAGEWRLNALRLHTDEAAFSAQGRWAAPQPGAPRRTALDFTLALHDTGALLTRLGMPGVVRGGRGQLRGQVAWTGAPTTPHYASMGGQLHLDVGRGQFLKADPGAAKLLGVLSLQALPRRLTLDFRDVFSQGFAFDFVRGDVQVAQGIASTRNLQMKGASAAVLLEGRADIAQETQDLSVLVVPEIDAGNAALLATLINPAVGLATFIAQLALREPLTRASTREFHIGGPWRDPVVTPLGRPRPRAAAPADAASAPQAAASAPA